MATQDTNISELSAKVWNVVQRYNNASPEIDTSYPRRLPDGHTYTLFLPNCWKFLIPCGKLTRPLVDLLRASFINAKFKVDDERRQIYPDIPNVLDWKALRDNEQVQDIIEDFQDQVHDKNMQEQHPMLKLEKNQKHDRLVQQCADNLKIPRGLHDILGMTKTTLIVIMHTKDSVTGQTKVWVNKSRQNPNQLDDTYFTVSASFNRESFCNGRDYSGLAKKRTSAAFDIEPPHGDPIFDGTSHCVGFQYKDQYPYIGVDVFHIREFISYSLEMAPNSRLTVKGSDGGPPDPNRVLKLCAVDELVEDMVEGKFPPGYAVALARFLCKQKLVADPEREKILNMCNQSLDRFYKGAG
ncbi:hypothetical protein IMZ48_33840 [Candidatus Bathyarchaeota archaeon]|nr:hypothetical protein [Candidatus Bathyarchaeota archaeon]